MKTETAQTIISRSPQVMSGAPVFAGTRVPVQSLLDYLVGGHPLEEFWKTFQPCVVSRLSNYWEN